MVFISFFLLALLSLGLLYRERLLKNWRHVLFAVLFTIIAFLIRALLLDFKSHDYLDFLLVWVKFYRRFGGLSALQYEVGNYNMPYLYFLAAISYLKSEPLYPIKILSVAFDVVLAYYAMKTVSLFTDVRWKRSLSFFIVLFLPTVVLNGAYWGQCDSLYSAFALMSVYYALAGKPARSVICVAVSFSLKLQAIFLIPVFFIFLLTKRIRLRHVPLFPLTYVVMMLPAVIAGQPFWRTILFYFISAESAGTSLNYNSPSVFAFDLIRDEALAAAVGIAAAFALVLALYVVALVFRKRFTNRTLYAAALLLCVGIPFLLPHMHDRYFFMADVMTVVFAFIVARRQFVPVLASFASLICYFAYLRGYYAIPLKYGAICILAVLVILLVDLLVPLLKKRKNLLTN